MKFLTGLYGILDMEAIGGRDFVEVALMMIRGGVEIIQLRNKKATDDIFLKRAKVLRDITSKAGVLFIINDRISIAKEVCADGVHLGVEDMGEQKVLRGSDCILDKIRDDLGSKEKIIGISTHSLSQALEAEKQGADYIGIGPVYKTETKPDAMPIGVEVVREVVRNVKIPKVAIGGINESNLKEILEVGVENVAMVREICGARDVEMKIRSLNRLGPPTPLPPTPKIAKSYEKSLK